MTTRAINLSTSAYVRINVSFQPIIIEAIQGSIHIVVSDAQPTVNNQVYHKLDDRQRLTITQFDENIWARAAETNARAVCTQEHAAEDPDYWISHAINVIYDTYGHVVSTDIKAKDLLKYGRTEQGRSAGFTTIMTLPTGTYDETYATDNLITTLSSSNAGDTEVISVEGHTIDGSGDFTFVVQPATLNGQNQVTLSTPLARCTRLANIGSNDLVGDIYAYRSGTSTSGVPDNDADVHCMIRAGLNQSEKASTTLSQYDYWILTYAYVDVLDKGSAIAEVDLEVRLKGGVFRKAVDFSASSGQGTARGMPPYIIIPPNSDIRMRCLTSTGSNIIVSGGLNGVLASIQLQ